MKMISIISNILDPEGLTLAMHLLIKWKRMLKGSR